MNLIFKEEKFRILKRQDDTGQKLRIFERELSVSLQDVFFRELAAEGNYIRLNFSYLLHNVTHLNLKAICCQT